ncbi:Tripeptidyl-peptidase 2 [Trichoplax sp. H2]|nr:Tripeptidyl-peptidase 2 [Trichoplax sp. H2]|eukprot:RDD39583.1 Tripeptidyl-peptidase 2 [Trichoplax sp. H2]
MAKEDWPRGKREANKTPRNWIGGYMVDHDRYKHNIPCIPIPCCNYHKITAYIRSKREVYSIISYSEWKCLQAKLMTPLVCYQHPAAHTSSLQPPRWDNRAGVRPDNRPSTKEGSYPVREAMASPSSQFPLQDLLPKQETAADRFLRQYPDYDGRGTIIAIFDTGVDPGADGLQMTSDGRRKIIDCIDCTGSGDVDTSTVSSIDDDGSVTGLTGRKLQIPAEWENPTGKFHLGIKHATELFPSPLCDRLKKEYRKKKWAPSHSKCTADAIRELQQSESKGQKQTFLDELMREELQQRTEQLKNLDKIGDESLPIFDCVVFHNGSVWRAVIDTTETGNLSKCTVLPEFRLQPVYGTFGEDDLLNYTISVYDDGNRLSIVTNAGSHGTHVACITSGYFESTPEKNGIAPGAQILSVKIGDTRLDSMETGPGIVRGLIASKNYGCDLINMSYGEACQKPNEGRIMELCNEFVDEHDIIMVSSAGNNGPAMSTVGSPGGTCSSVISVGAHVTPKMMAAQYSLLERVQSMQYTWTSRGPCIDGALGVSISAPGGAIASVPKWTLSSSQLMNGTSMSSPNACGGIALILSGLKACQIPFSPSSVRRAVENTASSITGEDHFSMGYGLLQVDKAFEYIRNSVDKLNNNVHFEITCGSSYDKRGIYLREPQETSSISYLPVRVRPCYKSKLDLKLKANLEYRISLVPTATWIDAPKYFMLNNSARSFDIKVDTSDLRPGAHYSEICGYDSACIELGPLFRIPITVTKPISIRDPLTPISESLTLDKGQIKRMFIATPPKATWVEIALTSLEESGKFTMVLDMSHLHKDKSFKYQFSNNRVTLGCGETKNITFKVEGEKTLELCLTSWWSTRESKKIKYAITFHSLLPNERNVAMHSCGGIHRITVTSPFRRENMSISINLDHMAEAIRPISSTIKPLTERDLLPNGRQIYENILDYKFSIENSCEVRPNVSLLSDLLYEALYESQLWMIFDKNKQHIASGDAFPHQYKVKLDKGDYILKLQVRHDKRDLLERLKNIPVLLEHKLANSVSLDVYSSQLKALSGGSKISNNYWLNKNNTAVLYFAPLDDDKLPKGAKPGMYLTGTISYSSSGKSLNYPFTYNIGTTPLSSSGSNSANNDFEAAHKKFMLSWLTRMDFEHGDKLYKDLEQKYEDDLSLKVERMKMLDVAANKHGSVEAFENVIKAAQCIIDLIDTNALLNFYGMISDLSENAAKKKSEMDEKKKYLTESLICKGKNMGLLAKQLECLEEESARYQATVSAMNDVYCELSKWIDLKNHRALAFILVHAITLKQYARAIGILQIQMKESSSTKRLYEEMIAMLEKLNWHHIANCYKRLILKKYPKNYTLF